MCVCKCVKHPGRALAAPLVLTALLAPAEPFCRAIFLSHWVSLTCPGSTCFPGRSIYYGSPCGSGGCSHWGKRRTDEPGGRKRSSRCTGWDRSSSLKRGTASPSRRAQGQKTWRMVTPPHIPGQTAAGPLALGTLPCQAELGLLRMLSRDQSSASWAREFPGWDRSQLVPGFSWNFPLPERRVRSRSFSLQQGIMAPSLGSCLGFWVLRVPGTRRAGCPLCRCPWTSRPARLLFSHGAAPLMPQLHSLLPPLPGEIPLHPARPGA